ncbi:hypothetical protein IFM89_037262 [Coptis chinensis]|uniref:FAD linked oxidase N-terminal domain-containing protein n=1 Tax=Coptis chinensis TaxID=261450 RepID=A0A835M2T4_9MAGN|nr:hypothetical protein IFM89_037262 [Coptis chinensis]
MGKVEKLWKRDGDGVGRRLSSVFLNQGSWTIRLRSGGHSFEGLSHIADTPCVIIDMMNLNQVSIDLDSKTAWIESGATLGEMYYAISQASISLSFPAGWCPTVGIGDLVDISVVVDLV